MILAQNSTILTDSIDITTFQGIVLFKGRSGIAFFHMHEEGFVSFKRQENKLRDGDKERLVTDECSRGLEKNC